VELDDLCDPNNNSINCRHNSTLDDWNTNEKLSHLFHLISTQFLSYFVTFSRLEKEE
jgi:hypothetical protein